MRLKHFLPAVPAGFSSTLGWMMLSGVGLGLSAPGWGLGWLAWVALIPALRAIQSAASLPGVLTGGFLLGACFQGLYFGWFFDLHPLTWLGFSEGGSRAVTLAGWLLLTVEGGLITALLMGLYRQLPRFWGRGLVFAVCWVLGFGLLNLTPLALPWALLDYTQAGLWPLRWLSGWVGASGLTVLLVWHNASWADARLASGSRWRWLLPCLTPVLLGGVNQWPEPAMLLPHWSMPVAVVQAGLPIELIRSGRLTPAVIEPAYLAPVEKAHFPSGTLLVYPEEGVAPGWVKESAPLENGMMRRLQALSRRKRLWIAVGVSSRDAQGRAYNSLAFMSPDGGPVQYAHKRRLVPFGEFTPYGLGAPLAQALALLGVAYNAPYASDEHSHLLKTSSHRLGGLICFDLMDAAPGFDGLSAQYRRAGAQWLVNSSNLGWFHQNPLLEAQFLAIGQMRAAENRLPLVIASNTGISAIVSPTGQILRRTRPLRTTHPATQLIFFP